MKKRVLPLLLALCMVVGLVPNIAYADDPDIYISEADYEDFSKYTEYDGWEGEDASGNHWSYDATTKTLTLNNFRGSVGVYCSRVVLIGKNTAVSFGCSPPRQERYASPTIVEGSGSLEIINGIYGSFVLDNQLQMIGGSYKNDMMPLTMENGKVVKPDGTPADYIRIEPIGDKGPLTTGRYTDVPFAAWYYEAVEYVSKPANNSANYGLMDGTASTTFSPNDNADRATIVTALYRKSGDRYGAGNNPNQKLPYSDISREILPIVYWANDCNITTGYGDGRFGPNDPVTREQFAVFLYRYAQEKYRRTQNDDKYELSARANLSQYTDSGRISSWAVDAMSWANARGFITGVTDTTLNPSAYVTRAEVATILMRAMVI